MCVVFTGTGQLTDQLRDFVAAECLRGHITKAAQMDLDAFERALCPAGVEGERCGATLTIYRSPLIEEEAARVRQMLKAGDTKGLTAYVNRHNQERARQRVKELKEAMKPE